MACGWSGGFEETGLQQDKGGQRFIQGDGIPHAKQEKEGGRKGVTNSYLRETKKIQ